MWVLLVKKDGGGGGSGVVGEVADHLPPLRLAAAPDHHPLQERIPVSPRNIFKNFELMHKP